MSDLGAIRPIADGVSVGVDGLDCYCAAVAHATAAYGPDYPPWFLALAYFHAHYDVPAADCPGSGRGTSLALIYWTLGRYFGLAPEVTPSGDGRLGPTVAAAIGRGAPVLVPVHTWAYSPSPEYHSDGKSGPHLLLVKGCNEDASRLTVFDCEHNQTLLLSRIVEVDDRTRAGPDAAFRLAGSAGGGVPLAAMLGDVWSDLAVPLEVVEEGHRGYDELARGAPLAGTCATLVPSAAPAAGAVVSTLADVLGAIAREARSAELEQLVAAKREALVGGARIDLPSTLLYASSQRVVAKVVARRLQGAGAAAHARAVEEAGVAAARQWRSLVLESPGAWDGVLRDERRFLGTIEASAGVLEPA